MDLKKTNEIKSIELVKITRNINKKQNGFVLTHHKERKFLTKNGENVKLLINSV
jgi:hypothetical protein